MRPRRPPFAGAKGIFLLGALLTLAGIARSQNRTGPELPADDSLTWHGITLYGAYDIGLGWVSHGLAENGYNYEGESLVNRNGNQSRFLIAQNNLQQSGVCLLYTSPSPRDCS